MKPFPFERGARPGVLLAALLVLGACGGDADGGPDATPDDVSSESPASVTDAEREAFTPPADSMLTEAQVEAYLKTGLLHFDLVRQEGAELHERLRVMKERDEKGGTVNALRNMADVAGTLTQVENVIGGSYVRAARTLGHNPAELEWVRERMMETGIHLAMLPAREQAAKSAAEMRAQAEALRKQVAAGQIPGYTEADVQSMIDAADDLENMEGTSAAALRNVERLRAARPAVTDRMWSAIGWMAGGTGFAALASVVDANDAEGQRRLDEFRQLYADALANRASGDLSVLSEQGSRE